MPILLTRLAMEEPGLYAKSASREGGLQGHVEAIGESLNFQIFSPQYPLNGTTPINAACVMCTRLHHFRFFHMHYQYIFED